MSHRSPGCCHQRDQPGRTPVRSARHQDRHRACRAATPAQHPSEALRRAAVDDAVAISYGRLAAVVDAGRQPRRRAMDLLIAATAHAHGARLYTRNIDDFAGLERLVDIVAV